MIFQKAKRVNRKTKAFLGFILLLCLMSGFLVYRYFTREQHCVTGISAENQEPMGEAGTEKCFDTQAEALGYISEGRIVLPENASPEEVDAAINQYNSEMATLETAGNE